LLEDPRVLAARGFLVTATPFCSKNWRATSTAVISGLSFVIAMVNAATSRAMVWNEFEEVWVAVVADIRKCVIEKV